MQSQQSPTIKIDQLRADKGTIYVVRDDVLPGGTKQRAMLPLLAELYEQGYREFVYASPFAGFAQIALSASCQKLGYQCTLFCEEDRDGGSTRHALHELSEVAKNMGASIHVEPTLAEAEIAAKEYCDQRKACFLLPFGFHCQVFTRQLKIALQVQWVYIEKALGKSPKALWLPVGSGTLATVFRYIVPNTTYLKCISVNMLEEKNESIQWLLAAPKVSMQYSCKPFIKPACEVPPIPSSRYYDAKLWSFIREQAEPGDVWWNVAR